MTAFDDFRLEFIDWCRSQRESLQKQRDLFSSGTCRMHTNGQDTTKETVTRIDENIAQLDSLMAKCEAASDA